MGDVKPDELSPELLAVQQRLEARFGERIAWQAPFRGELSALVGPGDLLEVLAFARDDAELAFRLLSDVTAVDWLDRLPRFDVVYHLFSLRGNLRLRVKVQVDEGQAVPSVTPLWEGANFPEREVYDMFGIRIVGHPNLERILMPEDYPGHPLRRDFSIGEEVVDFDIPHRKRFSHAAE